jgi:hypothetical protein
LAGLWNAAKVLKAEFRWNWAIENPSKTFFKGVRFFKPISDRVLSDFFEAQFIRSGTVFSAFGEGPDIAPPYLSFKKNGFKCKFGRFCRIFFQSFKFF